MDDQDVEVKDVPVLEGFTKMSKEELDSLRQTLGWPCLKRTLSMFNVILKRKKKEIAQ